MRTKMMHFCKRGLTFLLALMLCISLLPGMAMTAEAKTAPKSGKTVSATIKFWNHTGKRISELYFEDSKVEDYGDEYLATRNFKYWSNKKYIMVPLKFKKSVSLDFFIRYSDGSSYEAQGLKLAKATAKGSVIDLTKSRVSLKVKNKKVASAKFVKAKDENDDTGEESRVTGIRLNKTSATVVEGQTMYLTAKLSPSDAYDQVTWSSSDTSVATVNNAGRVTGVKTGTATITAKTADGGYTASCQITVTPKAVKATGVNLNKSSLSLAAGGSSALTATVNPAEASDKTVTWSSSNSAVATVSSTGTVTGIKAGTATITVKTADGRYKATCKVTVSNKRIPVTSVKLNKTSLSLSVGGTSTLTKTVYPSGATSKTVRWTSSDTTVATVSSSGQVTGVKPGTATITVTTVDGGYTASCKVTVTAQTISKTINFYNRMGKQISELYFVESGDSWGEEYLSTHKYAKFNNKRSIPVPMTFTTDASLDFYIRCSDGSEYEARGLSLEKGVIIGVSIELTESKVSLSLNGGAFSSAALVKKKAPTNGTTKLSDADWAALQSAYQALNMAYTYVANAYNDDQIKANKEIEDAMKSAQDLIMEMGTIKREGLSAADGKKLLEAMELTAKALQDILDAMETVPQTRTINVKFINGTTADFTNFSAKPEGGTGSAPETLKSDGETTLQFTVADTASAFEITFTESLNNQPYTMTVTFDSSVKDGDTLTVQFNVNEQTQQIVYSQQ